MKLYYKRKLEKLKSKNTGNTILTGEINKLIRDIEHNQWKIPRELFKYRPDADCVHPQGIYFLISKIIEH